MCVCVYVLLFFRLSSVNNDDSTAGKKDDVSREGLPSPFISVLTFEKRENKRREDFRTR